MPIDPVSYILTTLRKNPSELTDILASAWTTFKFRFLKRCIGKKTIVRNKTMIRNSANVRIGDHCILQDFIYIRAGDRGRVTIGNHCMINSFCRFFGHGSIEIGEHCQLGPGTTITTTEHDYRDPKLAEIFRKVTVGKRVWTGSNVTVLPGVTIGDNTIVGAGGVVKQDLPPNCIAAGVPARVIKLLEEEQTDRAGA